MRRSREDARRRYEALVRAHHGAVFRAAWQLLRSADDAQDVTQEVFTSVLRGRLRLAETEDPERVLRWMTCKAALQHLRREESRRQREVRVASERDEAVEDEAVEERERSRALSRGLARLKEELRVALLLRFREGMSFRAIAEAAGVSENTARQRVLQGLERLGRDLGRMGYTGIVPTLEGLLARPELAPVPIGLEGKLLELGGRSLWLVSSAWAPVALVAAVLVGSAAVLNWDRLAASTAPDPGPDPVAALTGSSGSAQTDAVGGSGDRDGGHRRAVAQRDVASGAASIAGGVDGLGEPQGRIEGQVVDARGRPVAAVLVNALPELSKSDWERWRGEVDARTGSSPPAFRSESDAEGRFAIDVPICFFDEGIEVRGYRLRIAHPNYEGPDEQVVVKVAAGSTTSLQTIEATALSDDQPGDYVLAVRVVGAGGTPVEGAFVRVRRLVPAPGGGTRSLPECFRAESGWTDSAAGRTDPSGRVDLHGAWLGRKEIAVDALDRGYRHHRLEMDLPTPGHHDLEFTLEPGLSIEGVVRTPPGASLRSALMEARSREAGTRLHRVRVAEDGAFQIVGLAPGSRYDLHFVDPALSHFRVDEVLAGSADLVFETKRADDPTGSGLHMGEIHGRLRLSQGDEKAPLHLKSVRVRHRGREAQEVFGDLFPSSLIERGPQPPFDRSPASPPGLPAPPPGDHAAFHVVGLPPGICYLDVRVLGLAPTLAGPFQIEGNEILRGVEIPIATGFTLSGRVEGPAGEPLPGVQVFTTGASPDLGWEGDEVPLEAMGDRGYLVSDREGRFVFPHLPGDLVFRILARHPSGVATLSRPLHLQDDLELTLRLEPSGSWR